MSSTPLEPADIWELAKVSVLRMGETHQGTLCQNLHVFLPVQDNPHSAWRHFRGLKSWSTLSHLLALGRDCIGPRGDPCIRSADRGSDDGAVSERGLPMSCHL